MKFCTCASFSKRSIYYIYIPCAINMERTMQDWIELIEIQIVLSDTGENTYDLNGLYYDFYLHVKERIQ